tara:strand:- start:19406 stop:20362 length:957 start_codon:yes stop_codon:yes gene_type:complete
MKKSKKSKTKKKSMKRGGSGQLGIAAASGLAGTYAGNTIQKKFQREGQTWFSHLLFSYLDLVWYLSKTFVRAGTYIYKEAVIYSIDYYFGRDITNASMEDLTSEVKEKLIKSARLAAAISSDKEAMDNLKETGEISAKIMGDVLEELEEPLMELTNKAVDILEGICLNLTAAGVDIGVGVLGAAMGQIPFLGAMINIIITAGRVANRATETMSETGDTAGKLFTLLGSAPQKPLDKMIDSKEKVSSLFEQINNKVGEFNDLKESVAPTGKEVVSGITPTPSAGISGGGYISRLKKMNSPINNKTRKRIMKAGYKRHTF